MYAYLIKDRSSGKPRGSSIEINTARTEGLFSTETRRIERNVSLLSECLGVQQEGY